MQFLSSTMGDRNKKLSGAEYKKRAKQKLEKEEEVVKKTRKLDTFFSRPVKSANDRDIQGVDTSAINACASSSTGAGDGNMPELMEFSFIPIQQQQVIMSRDPAEWIINDLTRDEIAANGVKQNLDSDFSSSKRIYGDQTRYLSRSLFERRLVNGEKSLRNWLIYSESTGRVYCGPCLAFDGGTQFGSKEGFNDWKNASIRVADHENSSTHKLSLLNMKKRGTILGRVDLKLTQQLDATIVYWRNLLKRVVATIKALVSRGLPFRGHNEKFGSPHNGNYLMSLELIAEFDPFLADHIARHGNSGSGHTSYLSSSICEEFIGLMAKKVTNTIVTEIKLAKYFSIIVDSTPDISHIDQLTFVVRYVQTDGTPIERFLKFIPNAGHKALDMTKAITATLDEFAIDIANCRGQSYDNAANMSGAYNGLQAQIKKLSPLAEYIPCAAHSLNLIGESAAEECEEACWFFALLQEIYNFFTASTQRWGTLQQQRASKQKSEVDSVTNVTPKSLSTTRWSARADACKSLYESWHDILGALDCIEDDENQKPSVRCEAKGIRLKLERLETAFMVRFWGFLLGRFNLVNKKLQAVDIDIFTIVHLYDSLISLVSEARDNFEDFEAKAKEFSAVQEYEKDTKPKRKRRLRPGESASEEVEMTGRDHLRVATFTIIIDKLLCELQKRREAYVRYHIKFSFLTNLAALSSAEIEEKAESLRKVYASDLEESFSDECLHFRAHCLSSGENWNTALKLLKWIRDSDMQSVYPNIDIALRMCVCTPVTNCSGERSFSWLRRVKNYLRSKMKEDRLNALAILGIESDLLSSLEYDDLIDSFATQKSRRAIL